MAYWTCNPLAAGICADLLQYKSPHLEQIFVWALDTIQKKLCREVTTLTEENSGLHFNTSTPSISGLLDANLLWCHVSTPTAQMGAKVTVDTSDNEGDLGEIGGVGMDADSEGDKDKSITEPERKAKKRCIHAITQNTALLSIKSVVCISISLQSMNKRCNYLESMLGIFYHSTSVPEKVIKTLAHAEAAKKISFTSPELTVKNPSKFISATLATAIPLFGVENCKAPTVLNSYGRRTCGTHPQMPFQSESTSTI
ncbi:hypothetical protein L208DRAFT_1378389 [Tricholoma matsutake]|nr:hypothetical protein L208DRAFT_1378389 [Tricholoma matsutake 945]